MASVTVPKHQRLKNLSAYINENPFVTDEELAKIFKVSVPTIRLDRMELGIPELRERTKLYAENSYSQVKSLAGPEIIGLLVNLELEKEGLSQLKITEDMVFQKNMITRGHVLFAQANSLAVALIDADVALTGLAKVSFNRQVQLGEVILAKAVIKSKNGNKYNILVTSTSDNGVVFRGQFRVFAVSSKEGAIIEDRS